MMLVDCSRQEGGSFSRLSDFLKKAIFSNLEYLSEIDEIIDVYLNLIRLPFCWITKSRRFRIKFVEMLDYSIDLRYHHIDLIEVKLFNEYRTTLSPQLTNVVTEWYVVELF